MNILYIHGLSSSGESRTARTLRKLLPEDNIISPDLPIDPEEALDLLHRIVEEEKIDLAIGTSMGGMFAQKLHGLKKILVNPAFHVSEVMRANIGIQSFLNPRKDGATCYEITTGLCDEYEKMERAQFEKLPNKEKSITYGLFGTKDTTVNCIDEYRKYYYHTTEFDGAHRLSVDNIQILLVPLIETIRRNCPHKEEFTSNVATSVLKEEMEQCIADEFGGVYSSDGKRLLKYNGVESEYTVKGGTEIICDHAFQFTESDSQSPIKKVVLPESVRQIGIEAFGYCENLSTINIPEGVYYIGPRAFWGCHALVEIVLPDSLTVISRETFMYCFALEICKLGSNLRTIGSFAFYGCSFLQNIQLPESLENIFNAAFKSTSLQNIRIPCKVRHLGLGALYPLKTVSIDSPQCIFEDNPFGDTNVTFRSTCKQFKIVRKSLINLESGVLVNCCSHRRKYIIPKEACIIGRDAFESAKIQLLVLPPTVKQILSRGIACETLSTLVLCNPNIWLRDDTYDPAIAVVGHNNLKTIFVPVGYREKFSRYCTYQRIRHPNREIQNIAIKEFEFADMTDVEKLLNEILPSK